MSITTKPKISDATRQKLENAFGSDSTQLGAMLDRIASSDLAHYPELQVRFTDALLKYSEMPRTALFLTFFLNDPSEGKMLLGEEKLNIFIENVGRDDLVNPLKRIRGLPEAFIAVSGGMFSLCLYCALNPESSVAKASLENAIRVINNEETFSGLLKLEKEGFGHDYEIIYRMGEALIRGIVLDDRNVIKLVNSGIDTIVALSRFVDCSDGLVTAIALRKESKE